MSEDADMQRLKEACEVLSEFFDTVHIFTTRFQDRLDNPSDEGTVNCSWGSGNWFARKGQIDTWVIKQNERTKIDARKENE